MKKEIRIGLFAIIAIALLIWGYKYLLGTNLLNRSNSYTVEYSNIDGLQASDPVFINGLQVGIVQDIFLKPEDLKTLVVKLNIGKEIKLPPNTVASLRSEGMMGGKLIVLKYEGTCSDDCLKSGSMLQGEEVGLLGSMVDPAEIDQYMAVLKEGLGGVVDSITNGDPNSGVNQTVSDLRIAIANLKQTTIAMNHLFSQSSSKLSAVFSNLESVTGTLKSNNDQITGLLENTNEITRQLASARLDTTISKANQALGSSSDAIKSLESTLVQAQQTFAGLQSILQDVKEGDGTLGQLAQNKELYDNLSRTAKNLDLLLQDFRLNPKRYVNVSVFGKKQKEYTVPEEDPAFDTVQTN